MKQFTKKILVIFILCASITSAKATPLNVDSGWRGFGFPGIVNGSRPFEWFESFEFSLAQPGMLRVQDLGDSTDQFRVFDNGVHIFTTSTPSGGGVGDILNPDIAATIPELSHGAILLSTGSHVITGTNIRAASTDYGGGAAIRVDTVSLSEPTILSLFILGGIIFRLKQRNFF